MTTEKSTMKNAIQAFSKIFEIVQGTETWKDMASTVENSQWHREESVAKHTEMCVEFYLNNVLSSAVRTERQALTTMIALLFHDFGKPEAEETMNREDGTSYRRYVGHEPISANAMIDVVLSNDELMKLMHENSVDLRSVKFMIEHHLPYGMTNKTKLANLALAVELNCDPVCFYDLLWSDCNGRISDDHETKRQNVLAWIEMFKAVQPTKFRQAQANQKTMYVLVAPVGAGKSTWTKNHFGTDENFIVISEDDARERYFEQFADDTFKTRVSCLPPKEAYTAMWNFAADAGSKFQAFVHNEQVKAVSSDKTLVLDRTNRTRKSRASMIALARQHGYKIVSIELYVPLRISQERQFTRTDKYVPSWTVNSMYYQFQTPWFGVEVDEVHTIGL